jgi:hypothetical protein
MKTSKKKTSKAKPRNKRAAAETKATPAAKRPKATAKAPKGVRAKAARRTAEGKFTKVIFNQIGGKECRRFAAMTWKERDAFMAKPENAVVRERYENHLASISLGCWTVEYVLLVKVTSWAEAGGMYARIRATARIYFFNGVFSNVCVCLTNHRVARSRLTLDDLCRMAGYDRNHCGCHNNTYANTNANLRSPGQARPPNVPRVRVRNCSGLSGLLVRHGK